MRWPADHPAVTDPSLAPWAQDVDRLCPEAEVVRVLRHLPGRRVSTVIRWAGGLAVLKIYATSRARGTHRRLSVLGRSSAGDVVPRPVGHRKGHLLLVEFVDGVPLSAVEGDAFETGLRQAGRALRTLHDCGARLDRQWTIEHEIAQLERTAGAATRSGVEEAIRRWTPPATGEVVPSHRDCYPAQAILALGGVRFIDLDDAALAPRALDVGNFAAHLMMDALAETRRRPPFARALTAFIEGYGEAPADFDCWMHLSLARLAALEETRHGSSGNGQQLLTVVLERSSPASVPSALSNRAEPT